MISTATGGTTTMGRSLALLAAAMLVCTLTLPPAAAATAATLSPVARYAPPPLLAAAAALFDVTANRWLLLDNADVPRPQASTTKIMTAIVALTYGRLDDSAAVDASAAALGRI